MAPYLRIGWLSRLRMTSFDVSVQIMEGLAGLLSSERLRQIAECALVVGSSESDASLSVVVASDEVVRDLNRRHRGLDENTDVLSFSFTHQGEYYGNREEDSEISGGLDFVLPPGEDLSLGEVIVSYHQAQRQAVGSDHTVEREVALLVIHGVLHLLGYDHVEPGDEAVMKKMENSALRDVFNED